ncbi:sulfite exporter TauE/SafE family protein [Saccharopolyspora endophytica]|uniref:Probable membrane transporter protein n=1 Tax=Saccharopolyspora endophytica TaxID=543886 RepID=A0ABS5DGX1_9PSEU|nr:sulfite exporter TauE/SafE family protein [Saccharopolyspora endophytica]
MTAVILGGLGIVTVAALLGGMTGFGFNIVATPLLLVLGVAPSTAVAVTLTIALVTRIQVVYRLRQFIRWPRALPLSAASLPGLVVGASVGAVLDPQHLRIGTGVLAMIAAPIMLLSRPRARRGSLARYAVSGFAGGALATTTSLNGIPPALGLSADAADQRGFIADLAVYFVLSNVVGLSILLARDGVDPATLELLGWWLPCALAANWAGTALAPRIDPARFRLITCGLVVAAGVVTLTSA